MGCSLLFLEERVPERASRIMCILFVRVSYSSLALSREAS